MGREIISVVEEEEEEEQALMNGTVEDLELPFLSLNHVSFVCQSVNKSVRFYEQVLGFVRIKRPSSFDFEGAWLFNHGIGIHLLQTENHVANPKGKTMIINPKDNHISFQCTDMDVIIDKLEEMEIEFVTAVVREGGITVDQIFFHDPDGYMVEICNCHILPILPLSSPAAATASSSSCPMQKKAYPHPIQPSFYYGKGACRDEVEAEMMENLAMDMLNILI